MYGPAGSGKRTIQKSIEAFFVAPKKAKVDGQISVTEEIGDDVPLAVPEAG